MASSNEDDSQTYFILGLAVGIIALVILLVVGVAIGSRSAALGGERAAPSPTTVSMVSTTPVQGAPGGPGAGGAAAVVTESVAVVVPAMPETERSCFLPMTVAAPVEPATAATVP